MNIIDEIKKIDGASATATAIFFLSLLGPGFLTIFNFKRELFINLETIKLIILSISISAPGIFIPYAVTAITISTLTHAGKITKSQLGTGATWYQKHGTNNAINMYLTLFITYVISLSFSWFAWCFLSTILFSALFEIWHLVKSSRNPEEYIHVQSS